MICICKSWETDGKSSTRDWYSMRMVRQGRDQREIGDSALGSREISYEWMVRQAEVRQVRYIST